MGEYFNADEYIDRRDAVDNIVGKSDSAINRKGEAGSVTLSPYGKRGWVHKSWARVKRA